MNPKILIVGYGVVGQLEYQILKKLKPIVCDKKTTSYTDIDGLSCQTLLPSDEKIKCEYFDLAVICVPTPTVGGKCNVDAVYEAVKECNAKVYLIKSTVAVGTCDEIAFSLNKRIVHSPEHSGATQHCNNFEYNFTVLGGNEKDCQFVQQIYQEVYDARHTFKYVNRKTSELSKYMLNAYLATKVSFCSEFWKVAQELDISYEQLRECFILDPRIEPAHTYIYDKHPYWESHCFDKDIPAIANQFNMELLKTVNKVNKQTKKEYSEK